MFTVIVGGKPMGLATVVDCGGSAVITWLKVCPGYAKKLLGLSVPSVGKGMAPTGW